MSRGNREGREGGGRGLWASRALVAAAYLRVEEEGAPFGVHPPAVVAGDVELERGLGEGATIAQDELGVARVPDPRLEVAIQPLPWEIVAPGDERLTLGVLRTCEECVSESRAIRMAKQPAGEARARTL